MTARPWLVSWSPFPTRRQVERRFESKGSALGYAVSVAYAEAVGQRVLVRDDVSRETFVLEHQRSHRVTIRHFEHEAEA